MTKVNRLPFLLLAVAVIAAPASGSDIPSLQLGKETLSAQYSKRSHCVDVTGFKKTNGQSSEAFGVKYYVMEYSADLTFVSTCYGRYDAERRRFSSSPDFARSKLLPKRDTQFQRGDKVSLDGKLYFQKKENGWSGK